MKENFENDLSQKYGIGVIAIHWISSLLIFILFPLGKYMSGLELSEKTGLLKLHIAFGFLVFILSIIRGILFFKSKRPDHLKTGNKLNDYLAMGVQRSFYFILIGLGISGIATLKMGGYIDILTVTSPDYSNIIPKTDISAYSAHGLLSIILMILIALHVIGVIRHIIRTKENVLKRITK